MIKVNEFIENLRKSDKYIETIYMEGGCYQFHLLLKSMWPDAKPLISKESDHIVSVINEKMWDITGHVSGDYYDLSDIEEELVKEWSFHKHSYISIGECEFCEEPKLVPVKGL